MDHNGDNLRESEAPADRLPPELEERVFDAYFGTPPDRRREVLEEIAGQHPDDAPKIRVLVDELTKSDRMIADFSEVELAPGACVGRYRVVEKLGEGGFGAVYLAEQTEPIHRQVALKVLLPGMDSRQVLARFEAERQALALMKHPSIAAVLDAGATDQGRPYVVMEHVPGVAITEYCSTQRLTTRQRLSLFLKVCDGVHHSHQKGVIHRDLKPSNILVMVQDGEAVPKIIDFGVAKALSRPLTSITLHTELGRVVGTPAYMSPEQAEMSTLDIDTRSDVYSLGVLLYELLTDALPFDVEATLSRGLPAVRRAIREVEPPVPSSRVSTLTDRDSPVARRRRTDLRELSSELRGDLDWIVMKAIEKDRTRRYETVRDLASDVQHHLRHEPVLAGPPSFTYRLGKFIRRNRNEVVAAGVVVLSLVVGFATSLALFFDAKEQGRIAHGLAIEAARREQEAKIHLANFDRLVDRLLLDRLRKEADEELWPERPEKVSAMHRWLREARDLASRTASHRDFVASLEGDSSIPARRRKFLAKTLGALVRDLETFGDTIASVETRVGWVEKLQRVLSETQTAWDDVRREIGADPRYAGLDMKPQWGLVPIGRDPDSQLFEFAHPRTGTVPKRGSDHRLRITSESSLVLVLLPPGRFLMGAQSQDPGGRNYDPYAAPFEGPVHRVRISAYFLSKYEMNQAQWERITGTRPSYGCAGREVRGVALTITDLHPVEEVSWADCDRWTRRMDLQLPSMAEWEYACRAGSAKIWPTGDTLSALVDFANLGDLSARKVLAPGEMVMEDFDDGYPLHAPVNALKPNAFGFHHMIGNVAEWCSDSLGGGGLTRPMRGGGWRDTATRARSAAIAGAPPGFSQLTTGLRPGREIE